MNNNVTNTERKIALESDDWRGINKDTEIIVGSSSRKPNYIRRMINKIINTERQLALESDD